MTYTDEKLEQHKSSAKTYTDQMADIATRSETIRDRFIGENRDPSQAELDVLNDLVRESGEVQARLKIHQDAIAEAERIAAAQSFVNGVERADLVRGSDDAEGFLARFSTPGQYADAYVRAYAAGDRQTLAQFERAISHTTTSAVPGLIPTPVVGPLLDLLEENRIVANAFTRLPLTDTGMTYLRPHVKQHTIAGKQSAEKAEVASRQYQVEYLTGTVDTIGGALNVSRQVIDRSNPDALDAIWRDLTLEVAQSAEMAVVTEAVAKATANKTTFDLFAAGAAAATPQKVLAALTDAAVSINTNNENAVLPNRIIVSVDTWAALKKLTYTDGRSFLDPANGKGFNNGGESAGLGSFMFSIDGIDGVVSPHAPAKTFICAWSGAIEVRENTTSLLQVTEPKILGLEVAAYLYQSVLSVYPKALSALAA